VGPPLSMRDTDPSQKIHLDESADLVRWNGNGKTGLHSSGGKHMSQENGSIVVARALRKVYRGGSEVEALRGIDLEIGRGELLAIVGPSGSGKTTLLNCLSGLEQIDGGEVLVDGKDLATLSDDERTEYRAKSMGFVFQAFNLLPVLSAVENVEIPMLLLGERTKVARARALETLDQVGLAPRAGHKPEQLSGGEQQRVAVARALVHRPAVVFADEPTGNLDSESTQSILDLFLRLNADGQTIVMVTHNPGVAEAAGRRIAMRDGRIEGDAVTPTDAVATVVPGSPA
jgi:putative ABC transport system ATP-binding protein